MSKTNQGTLLTASPAIGTYKITVDMKIDDGYTGIVGEVYPATNVDYWRDTGVTGYAGANFTNMKDPNIVGRIFK